ncbi:LOW QUALITY PROTEIN: SH3 and PX domain-containing protein 2B-like [Amphiura filiformis]|uniref:LOW QUALITY PROTEIN: SH3 and PX domain-containing protein 2B-like n=1 Tax=Amphiura filiformis TaxID=82378 RepID=UPI003B2159CA
MSKVEDNAAMVKRTVVDARVTDVEKRRYPSKHYVYLITVTWSDNAVNIIYRRYSKFFDFQMKLFALFPEEAGAKNPSQRMIPFLPGKKLFGRSHTREVALRRLGQVDEYCRVSIGEASPKISDCEEVINFFSPTNEDINPPQDDDIKKDKKKGDIEQISDPIQSEQYMVIADYKKQQKNEVDLHAGDVVEVFEKGENGWWFVSVNDSQGWAPGTFLATSDSRDEEETLTPCDELFITNNEYVAQQPDEVSFQRGVVLNVIQKSLDGWWKVRYQEKEGWVPATYLQEYRGPNTIATPSTATQIIGNVMNISDLESRKAKPLPITQYGVSGTSDDRRSLALAVGGTDVKPTPPRRTTVRRSRKSHHRYSYGDTNLEEGERTALTGLQSSEKKRYSYDDTNIGAVEKTVRRGGTRIKNPRPKTEYFTVADFAGSSTDDSITFLTGQKVEVLQQTESGWWFVSIDGQEGWAPSTFIEGRQMRPGISTVNSSAASRSSNTSLGSLDEETGEKNRKINTKVQIGSSNGAFTPFSPHAPVSPNSKRPLPSIPSVDEGIAESSGGPRQSKTSPSSCPSKARTPADPGVKQGGGVDAFDNVAGEIENKRRGTGALPPPVTRRITQENVAPPQWITVASYDKENDTEIGFREGTHVEIVEKDDSGWWLIRIGADEGWAPSTFLEKM